uniref:Peptidase A1 domain-containing protein n=1 Tax=Arundo donax TaxID=35708 RepID=A0A0A9BZ94_ARUDO
MAASCCPSRHGCLLLLLALLVVAASGAGTAARGAGSSSHVQLNVESLFPAAGPSCPTPQEQNHGAATGTRMPVVHQHGPCSLLADAHGKTPSHVDILAADQRRVEYIHRRVSETTGRGRPVKRPAPSVVQLQPGAAPSAPSSLSSSAASANLPASSGRALGTGNYVVPIGLGTPAARFTVVFDTGSDTTWVQCQPCVASCYRQKEPLFTPARSSTYANISCASSYCSDLYTSGCDTGNCLYAVQYGDGSYTVGFYAQDTLTLAYDAVKEFKFGCGEKNRGLFGRTAGLMGLGRGKTSLPVQAYDKYGGVFEYCLPATPSGTGFLGFGPGAAPAAANARLTPMLTDNGPTFYFVGVTGLKVGGHLLSIPESVFSNAGALVDSGTVITRLPPSAYEPLRSAFAKGMEVLGYKKAPAFSTLDTCYDLTGVKGSVALPAVSLVFQGGACLDVDASGILYVADVSQACLAFAANEDDTDVAIVGNTQQKTYGVLYDIGKKVVGFAPGAC